MESPLSPILANMILHDLETDCLQKILMLISVFYRYVDDIFIILFRNKINLVLSIFNSYHP